jgi:DNA-directed RNA polymerase subunit E'/Rpb7
MLKSFVIRKSFFVKNDLLNQHYKSNIKKYITNEMIDTCDKEYGYIFSIDKLDNIDEIIMSRANSNCIVKPILYLTCFKPEIGNNLSGEVAMIFPQGFFVTVYKVVNCLIPKGDLDDKGYSYTDGAFVSKTGEVISLDDIIEIELVATQYDKGKYNCIAKLK